MSGCCQNPRTYCSSCRGAGELHFHLSLDDLGFGAAVQQSNGTLRFQTWDEPAADAIRRKCLSAGHVEDFPLIAVHYRRVYSPDSKKVSTEYDFRRCTFVTNRKVLNVKRKSRVPWAAYCCLLDCSEYRAALSDRCPKHTLHGMHHPQSPPRFMLAETNNVLRERILESVVAWPIIYVCDHESDWEEWCYASKSKRSAEALFEVVFTGGKKTDFFDRLENEAFRDIADHYPEQTPYVNIIFGPSVKYTFWDLYKKVLEPLFDRTANGGLNVGFLFLATKNEPQTAYVHDLQVALSKAALE